MVKPRSVAVIDIGSNSIKLLVATRAPGGAIVPLHSRTIDARIGAGISHAEPKLSEAGMARGLEAVTSLLGDTSAYLPTRNVLVATSAVRDARNGAEFRARVQAATGHAIRILTGDEEANLIGRGLTADLALRNLRDFYVFDLGGGSLECLAFRDRRIEQAVSLQLGCVRLTEKFVADVAAPFSPESAARIMTYATEELARGGFNFTLPADAVAVGTGGTVTTVRAILGERRGRTLEQTDAIVAVTELRALLGELGAMALTERQKIPGLPPARADVFPTALATLIAVAETGGFSAYRNSLFNLRYGLADELLELA